MNNSDIGQYELIIKDLINPYNPIKNNNFFKNTRDKNISSPKIKNKIINKLNSTQVNQMGNDLNPMNCEYSSYQQKKIAELESHIELIGKNLITNEYENMIASNYLKWIDRIRTNLTNLINDSTLYYFFKFDPVLGELNYMQDYWDINSVDKLFSFSLFISNCENLTYLIGLVYNYAVMRKHFDGYVMRLYIDFHSVFGSAETFNLFNMFIDILEDIDPTFYVHIQMVVFFLNPYYRVESESIYESFIYDMNKVIKYYNEILYNTSYHYIKSPLLNINLEPINSSSQSGSSEPSSPSGSSGPTGSSSPSGPSSPTGSLKKKNKSSIQDESKKNKKNISINVENLEINYKNLETPTSRSTFAMFATHLAVNLRFLPLNEDCEFHIRDLDSRLSLTDKNIINKFFSPKYEYVPFYVFQFYKFYFPYLKWRIDVNPYLAGCFGGSNKKPVMVSKQLESSQDMKILKKEIFFKYILFISFNAANLQIGFLNDEFILANIFEKIKGIYSENILYLNLGSFANKHVNEYYYGISNSSNYPCILKLGIPIDILRYPLNGKYLTIDPITDFKLGVIPLKYHSLIGLMITEQLNIYLGKTKKEKVLLSNKIRENYKLRLDDEINDDLEAALFFSMIPKSYMINGLDDFNSSTYTSESYSSQNFSSIGDSAKITNNEKLKATNIMMCGYLLADILEDIIFPSNPQFINSNYFLSDDNYDRLFNCMYFDETKKKFIQKKINKKDISRKYVDQEIISHIPQKLIEFNSKQNVINELNDEFNEYLGTCIYYPSLSWYIRKISFNNFIEVDGKQIRSGVLLFVKNYTSPIYSNTASLLYQIDSNPVKTLKYKLDSSKDSKDSIKGIDIYKNKIKFNVLFIDDKFINQFNYSNQNNSSEINIKMLKIHHINKLKKLFSSNKYSDFLIIDNL
jgi:hypothetical protein